MLVSLSRWRKPAICHWLIAAGLLALAPSGAAAPQVTPISDVRNLKEGKIEPAVKSFRGVVTAFSGWKHSFFLQDSSGGISVDREEATAVQTGDQVEVTGKVQPGLFAPVIVSTATRVVGHVGIPASQAVDYQELGRGKYDSRLIQLAGIIHSAHWEEVWGKKTLLLSLHTAAGVVTVHVVDLPSGDFGYLVDSTVRVTGVSGTIFNKRRQLVGLRLFISNIGEIAVTERGTPMPSIPAMPISQLMRFDGPRTGHRVHVAGTVTHHSAPGDFFIQDDGAAVRVHAPQAASVQTGDVVDAWGFLSNSEHVLSLTDAVFKAHGITRGVDAVRVSASDVLTLEDGFAQAPYDGLLVHMEGNVTERLPSSQRQLWQIQDGRVAFQAQLSAVTSEQQVELESGVRVSIIGICVAEPDDDGVYRSFRVLLRSPADIQVLSAPYWNSSILLLSGIFLFVLVGSGFVAMAHRGSVVLETGDPVHSLLLSRFHKTSTVLTLFSGATGLLYLAGWNFYEQGLTLMASSTSIKPNTALAVWLGSLSLLAARRRGSVWMTAVWFTGVITAAFLGAATLTEFATTWDLGIDNATLFHKASLAGLAFHGRATPGSAFCLLLLGCSIGLVRFKRSTRFGQILAIATTVISTLSLIGYLYGFQAHRGAGAHSMMPVVTAMAILTLGTAIILRYPSEGNLISLTSLSPGALVARRVMPVALLCPVVIGYIRLHAQLAGMFDTRFGLALFALSNVVAFSFLVWGSAAILNRMDAARSTAETSTRARDRELGMIFETGAVGDFTWDAVNDVIAAHPSVWKIYGEPEGNGTGPADWFRTRQHPEDRERVDRDVRKAVESGGPLDMEFRVIWPDGTVRWVGLRGNPSYDSAGNLLQMHGLNFDITDRKMAEIRQQETELLFRELADAMPQIVWTARSDGSIDYYNRQWFEYTGLAPGEDWEPAAYPDDLETSAEALRRAYRDKVPYQIELRLRRARDGAYRWHLARCVPVLDVAGNVERWFGTSTDIEDFKRASSELELLNDHLEQRVQERSLELAESEGRFRQLVENVNDYAIFMLDANGRVASWNAGAQKSIGYTAQEILGEHFSRFHGRENVENGRPEEELALASEHGAYREEGWRVRKDGTEFCASVLTTVLKGADGNVKGFLKVVRDLTEQKHAEQLLVSAQKRAEEASQAKSSFLASMSHEIRTPMNAILGMADLLWETDLDAVQKEYVGRFRRAGSNLLVLINDILDLSKIENKNFALESIEFHLPDVLVRVNELMVQKADLKGITLATKIEASVPVTLIGDPARLQQILINLIGNAIKFTERGSVRLEAGLHHDGAANHIEFSVTDTGIGIPEAKLSDIFDDFTQAESSTTRRFGGTGLGLGICRRLAQQMGGALSVRSTPGLGSTFSFDAIFEICEAPGNRARREMGDLAGIKVLVVDDNATNRLIQSEMCTGWGMRPTQVSSVAEACRLAMDGVESGNPFPLVFLDHVMPDTEGFEALEKITRTSPNSKVIVTSSDDNPGDTTRAIALGAAAYLVKPIRRAELLGAISEALRGKLEAEPATPRALPAPEAEAHQGAEIEILIAEDSEDNRFLLAAYLQTKPYGLTFVKHGQEALEVFGEREFDLVLMDLQMPVMDGLMATASIRRLERDQSWWPTVVIALTANALVEDTKRALEAGCDAHLSKPISKHRLIAVIESFRKSYRPKNSNCEVISGNQKGSEGSDCSTGFSESMARLANNYVVSQRAELGRIQGLLAAYDFSSVQTFGHNLKGTGGSFGFAELGVLGSAIESAAKRADWQSLRLHLADVENFLTVDHG